MVTRLQRALSIGMFGEGARRKLVPTRWSITAVDSTISLQALEKVKGYPTIDEYRVYSYSVYDNQYVAILLPEPWRFEWIEAWFPNTTWNQFTNEPYMIGDYEEHFGRKTYAKVGGCYYSTRLAVAEELEKERRQAAAIVLRETYPGLPDAAGGLEREGEHQGADEAKARDVRQLRRRAQGGPGPDVDQHGKSGLAPRS